jgi:hypothetical protein
MVERIALRYDVREDADHPLRNEIRKRVRDRVDKCDVPDCWVLVDPNDNGQLALDRHFFHNSKHGRHVQIRQVLFQLTFHALPPVGRIIRTKCPTKNCVNPAHYKIAGWKMPYEDMQKLIKELNWITQEQAEELYTDSKGREYAPWYVKKLKENEAAQAAKREAEAILGGIKHGQETV